MARAFYYVVNGYPQSNASGARTVIYELYNPIFKNEVLTNGRAKAIEDMIDINIANIRAIAPKEAGTPELWASLYPEKV